MGKHRYNNNGSHPAVAATYTPEMLRAMTPADKALVKSTIIELVRTAQNFTKKDVSMWRSAWQLALNPENPQRRRLYEVYTDVDVDAHLTGAVGQRKGMVAQKAFRLVDKAKKENREATELLEAEWFKDFVSLALDSRYWGHSLIQFGDMVSVMGKPRFVNVELVPRAHVMPEYGVIVREVGDEPKKGFSYREGTIAQWCIEAGKSRDLGLLLKCAPQLISKKHMCAFWDSFGELFGMPIRIGKTISRDNKEISKIEKMLGGMGAAAWGLFPEGTEIEIKESARGDAFNVYDKRIERANSEVSKCILNQTMTIDSGSSLSQSQVHLEVFRNVVEADADFIRDLVNNRLLPFLEMHGFPVGGYLFEWDDSIEYTPDQMQKIEKMLLDGGYEIDAQYFTDKYNIPILGKAEPKPTGEPEPEPDGTGGSGPQKALVRPDDINFFV
jgi:phage gp29-like protein